MAQQDYRVQLDVFSGPLDLLLYLIRRDELDIEDIQIARITDQYLEYVKVIEQLDPNAAGEFLVMASTLLELKSRALLPTPPIEPLEDDDDPRTQLVKQLLEYKRFKDAARELGHAAEERAKRYVRRPADLPPELEGVELEQVEVWDLVSAFGRIMASIGQRPAMHEVRADEKPVAEYAAHIVARLEREGSLTLRSLLHKRDDRAELVGFFLALLELIRNQRVRAEQASVSDEIYLFALDEAPDEPEHSTQAVPQREEDT